MAEQSFATETVRRAAAALEEQPVLTLEVMLHEPPLDTLDRPVLTRRHQLQYELRFNIKRVGVLISTQNCNRITSKACMRKQVLSNVESWTCQRTLL